MQLEQKAKASRGLDRSQLRERRCGWIFCGELPAFFAGRIGRRAEETG